MNYYVFDLVLSKNSREDVPLVKHSEMKNFVQSLSLEEAASVLYEITGNSPAIMKKAYEAALNIVNGVDTDIIAKQVFGSLNSLDLEDLVGRSGRTRYGYVEPTDAAWELFEEMLAPFVSEMKKNNERNLPAVAKAHCKGIIKGLQKYDEESNSDFAGWVEDAPGNFIESVVDEWKKGNPSDEDIAEVMNIAGVKAK